MAECAKIRVDEDNLDTVLSEMNNTRELKPYSVYTEAQLTETISDLRDRISKKKSLIQVNKSWISTYEQDIERLEKKEPHKYQDSLGDLNNLFNKSQELQQKFLYQYAGYINNIVDRKYPTKHENPEHARASTLLN